MLLKIFILSDFRAVYKNAGILSPGFKIPLGVRGYSIAHILLSASLFIFLIFHLLLFDNNLLSAILNNIIAVPIANIICIPLRPKKDKAMICDNCFIKYFDLHIIFCRSVLNNLL